MTLISKNSTRSHYSFNENLRWIILNEDEITNYQIHLMEEEKENVGKPIFESIEELEIIEVNTFFQPMVDLRTMIDVLDSSIDTLKEVGDVYGKYHDDYKWQLEQLNDKLIHNSLFIYLIKEHLDGVNKYFNNTIDFIGFILKEPERILKATKVIESAK